MINLIRMILHKGTQVTKMKSDLIGIEYLQKPSNFKIIIYIIL